MRNFPKALVVRTLVVCMLGVALAASTALAQAAPARLAGPGAAPSERVKMLDSIPGDAVAWVMVGSVKELTAKVDAFLKDILPPKMMLSREMQFSKMMLADAHLGETFNASGPLALVLMDPKKYAPKLVVKKAAATGPGGDATGGGGRAADFDLPPEVLKAGLPVLFILSGKDIAKMFPDRKAEADGALTKLTRGEQEAWALDMNGLVFISANKKVIQYMPPRLSAMVCLTRPVDDLLARNDVVGWINRKRCEELRGTAFAALLWRNFSFLESLGLLAGDDEGRSHSFNPMGVPLKWFRATRAGTFAQAEQMLGGLVMAKEGPRAELRVLFPSGGAMGKALAAAPKSTGPLTTLLPEGPFVFAYGCRKDVFRTPLEMKRKQAEDLASNPAFKNMPEATRKQLGAMVLAIHEQVTGVEHWAGQAREDGPLAIATVVRCKDAEALARIARDNVPVFEALLNSALGQTEAQERFKLTLVEPNESAGGRQGKADMIQVSHPQMDKMLQDEDSGAQMKGMMLRLFPGETKFRARIAAVDKTTLVTTVGGGRKFLADVVAAAKAGRTKLEASADVQAALKLMPENRFALFLVNVTNAAGFYGTAMMSASGMMGGAQIKFRAAPPVAVALSAERSDLVITVHVPALMIKRIMGAMTPGGATEDVEEDEDAPASRPATRPPAGVDPRGGADAISIEKKTTVREVPVTVP